MRGEILAGPRGRAAVHFVVYLYQNLHRAEARGGNVRVTDDRYSRDWRRLELAVRMIRHEARTGTIRQWTGLSDDRIRKLYRTYVQSVTLTPVRRHRGKTPSQTGFFLRNREARRHGALLAGLYSRLGLLDRDAAGRPLLPARPAMQWGGLVLSAYEAYLELCPGRCISFEHACHLLDALWQETELGLAACRSCAALTLVDRLRVGTTGCTFCCVERAPRGLATPGSERMQ